MRHVFGNNIGPEVRGFTLEISFSDEKVKLEM